MAQLRETRQVTNDSSSCHSLGEHPTFSFCSLLLHHNLTMVQGSEVNAVLVIMFKKGGACNI